MQELFKHELRTEVLYCRHCSAVETHRCYTRQACQESSIHRNECILTICPRCQRDQIFFAADFKALQKNGDQEFSCKIAGRNRIVVNDWVYVPGEPRPAQVKMHILDRNKNREVVTLVYENKREETLSLPVIIGNEKSSLYSYKLLPFQIGQARIGEHIYHVGRDQTGLVVGVIHERREKLLVQMEDRSLLIMERPGRDDYIDSQELETEVLNALHTISEFNSDDVAIHVKQQIVFLKGVCQNLREREVLRSFVEGIANVRAVVSLIKVYPRLHVHDAELEHKIHHRLFQQNTGIFGVQLRVENQVAYLRGYIQDQKLSQQIFYHLLSIEGLRDLELNLVVRKEPSFIDLERTRQVTEALKGNPALQSVCIRVSTLSGTIYLEGSVHSSLQKSTALLTALWVGKNLWGVENNLKVDPNLESESYIRMV
jgi:osmotically-inducible protein OsmY